MEFTERSQGGEAKRLSARSHLRGGMTPTMVETPSGFARFAACCNRTSVFGLKDKKISIWDHNRDLIFHRVSTVLEDPEAAKYI